MEWLATAIDCLCITVICVRALNMWQLGGYRFDGSKKLKKIFASQSLYGAVNAVVCYFVYFICAVKGYGAGGYVYTVFCVLGAVWFYFAHREKNARTPLKVTKRCIRFLVSLISVSAAVCFGLCAVGRHISYNGVRLTLALMPTAYLLSPPIFIAAAVVVAPIEQAVARIYIEGCKKALDAKTDLIKIGVTGSYGKTGVKNILAAMLAKKYVVYATPKSYNTPQGICIAVSEMPEDVQVFVSEMGARRKGDISRLCEIVKPECAVITGIAAQHLATFGTLQNIMDTKAELTNFVSERGGKSYFNTDNDYCKLMYRDARGKKYRTGVGGECFYRGFGMDAEGSSFSLCFGNGECVDCRTKLLGEHNASNVALAAAVAFGYGVSPREIADAVTSLKPVPHRLELVENQSGITIIDDGYNSNEEGARAALAVLSSFKGRRIVACQGLAEMGDRERDANFALGTEIAKSAEIAVLIGPYADDMREGALSVGMRDSEIFVEKNLPEAQELFAKILRRGDVLLIENDLSDCY